MNKQSDSPPEEEQSSVEPADTAEPQNEGSIADAMRDGVAESFGEAPQDEPDPPADPPADAPKDEAKPDDAKDATDKDDAELEPQLSERGRKRFAELKDEVKTEREAREVAEKQVDDLRAAWSDAGLHGEQFPQFLQFARLFNSDEPRDMTQAVSITQAHAGAIVERMVERQDTHGLREVAKSLDEMRSYLALQLGDEMPAGSGADPLASHPDLVQDVQELKISRERAIEMARYRDQQARGQRDQQAREQREQQTAQQAQWQSRCNTAAQQIAALEGEWAAKDLAWQRKQPELMRRSQSIMQTHPPEQWAEALRQEYDNLSQFIAPPAERERRPGPLSSGGVQGSGGGEPSNMADAMRAGVEAAMDVA